MMAPNQFETPRSRFEGLRSEWPNDPLIDWEQVERLFQALSPEDQTHCSRLAPRYLRICRRTGGPIASPLQWIAARGWEGFLEVERRRTRRLEAKATPAWVIEGTPGWAAWKRYRECQGQFMPSPESIRSERGWGWWFPAPFPPPNAKARGVRKVQERRAQRRSYEHKKIKQKSNDASRRQTGRRRPSHRAQE